MKKQAKSWLDYAHADLLVIQEIIDEPDLTQMVAFHSQQAIEKTFKAILEEKESSVPKVHDLVLLYKQIRKYMEIDFDFHILKLISQAYINSRYPADLGLLPEGTPSTETAKKMYESAKSIYEAVKQKWA